MTLAAPLGLLLLSSIGILLALYLYFQRRTLHVVPSLLLWRRLQLEEQRDRRITPDLYFWLQLIALTALSLALADPRLTTDSLPPAARTIVVLDTTSSMFATDVLPNRFEVQRGAVAERLRALPPAAEVALVDAGSRSRIVAGFTADRRTVEEALASLAPADVGGSLSQAMDLARDLAAGGRPASIEVFTDTNAEELVASDVVVHRVGDRDANVAITEFGTESVGHGDRRALTARVVVRNYSDGPQHALLTVRTRDAVVLQAGFTLSPHEARTLTVPEFSAHGRVVAELDGGDDFDRDDRAFAWVASDAGLRVAVVSRDAPFARDLIWLVGLAGGVAEVVDSASLATISGGFDAAIYDRFAPDRLPDLPALFFAPPPGGRLWPVRESVAGVELIDWDAQHPIFEDYEPLPALPFEQVVRVSPPPWMKTVAWGRSAESALELLMVGERTSRRYAVLAADLSRERLREDRALGRLLLLTRTLRWLRPDANGALVLASGQAADAIEGMDGSAECTVAAGPCVADGWIESAVAGEFVLRAVGGDVPVLVNFGAGGESELRRGTAADSSSVPPSIAAVPIAGRSISPWFYALAFVAVLLESLLRLREARR